MAPISSDKSDVAINPNNFCKPTYNFIKIKSINTVDDQVATTSRGMTTFSFDYYHNRQYTQLSKPLFELMTKLIHA